MRNAAAIEALDRYLDDDHAVPHAMLVQGAWGTGKTTFLRRVYLPQREARTGDLHERQHNAPIVVSLFGLATVADLQRRIWEEISPIGSRVGRLLGAGIDAVAGYAGAENASNEVRELFDFFAKNGIKKRVFMFDDLERAEGNLAPLLGFMNQLVETHEAKVILVGNEAELLKREGADWASRGEKLVGRRVEIVPDPDAIVDAIVPATRTDHVASFVATAREDILRSFEASRTGNMRSLAWALSNIERVVAALPDAPLTDQHTRDMAALIVAATMAVRAGRLRLDDLFRADEIAFRVAVLGRRERPLEGDEDDVSGDDDPVPPDAVGRLTEFQHRYVDARPDRPVIAYRFIGQAEASGRVDPDGLADWLRVNFSVGIEGDEPAWRRLWNMPELDQAELDGTIDELAAQLASGTITELGPLLHTMGAAIRLREFGDTRLTGGMPIVEFFDGYATRLADEGRIEPSEYLSATNHETGFGGLGYMSYGTPEFADGAHRIMQQAKRRHADAADRLAERIIAKAEGGDLTLLNTFDQTHGFEPLQRSPGFASIDVDRFARLVTKGGSNLLTCFRFIRERYQLALMRPVVAPEAEWMRTVIVRAFELLARKPELEARAKAHYLRSWVRSFDEGEANERKLCPSKDGEPVDGNDPAP